MKKTPQGDGCHIIIEEITPSIESGRYPAKRIAGERCTVEATVFRDGHDTIRVVLRWKKKDSEPWNEVPMILTNAGLDRWRGEFPLKEAGRYLFTIEAWTDRFASWAADLKKRIDGGQVNLSSEISEGVKLIGEAVRSAEADEKVFLKDFTKNLQKLSKDPPAVWGLVSGEKIRGIIARLQKRKDKTTWKPELEIAADRPRARFGSWYKLFVRSQGTVPGQSGTFRDATQRLPEIKKLGFDILYLAPIHPIGKTNRKGPNNFLKAAANDPGSPWAIGSEAGGHDAVEPSLGTLEDFDRFVQATRKLDMEIALDFAIQCSPDHPWVKEHPEWFYHRPDGTIKFAENPPKKYEDIYPLNFDTSERQALWEEMRRILLFWIDHGVRIFRVDNPHTKPAAFWRWLIEEIQSRHPDVFFLAEAFTRPSMMRQLAKAGFSQSYTYFTWRHTTAEFRDYLTELTQTEMREYYRPNFFANTPDILPKILVDGGQPAFKMRLVLASTLSPSYGIYSGYELCENDHISHHVIPGDIEYANSEKYEFKVRDWNRPGHIKDFIAKVNTIRRENRALQEFTNLKFFETDNDQILFYGKMTADRSNIILVAVNLDPHHPHHTTALVPLSEIGVSGTRFEVSDLLTGEKYTWTDRNYIRLDPEVNPVHILQVGKTLP